MKNISETIYYTYLNFVSLKSTIATKFNPVTGASSPLKDILFTAYLHSLLLFSNPK